MPSMFSNSFTEISSDAFSGYQWCSKLLPIITSCYSSYSERPRRCWQLTDKVENINCVTYNWPGDTLKFAFYWNPPNSWFIGPIRVYSPNCTSIGSSVFVGLTVMTNRQTHTHTHTQARTHARTHTGHAIFVTTGLNILDIRLRYKHRILMLLIAMRSIIVTIFRLLLIKVGPI